MKNLLEILADHIDFQVNSQPIAERVDVRAWARWPDAPGLHEALHHESLETECLSTVSNILDEKQQLRQSAG